MVHRGKCQNQICFEEEDFIKERNSVTNLTNLNKAASALLASHVAFRQSSFEVCFRGMVSLAIPFNY